TYRVFRPGTMDQRCPSQWSRSAYLRLDPTAHPSFGATAAIASSEFKPPCGSRRGGRGYSELVPFQCAIADEMPDPGQHGSGGTRVFGFPAIQTSRAEATLTAQIKFVG